MATDTDTPLVDAGEPAAPYDRNEFNVGMAEALAENDAGDAPIGEVETEPSVKKAGLKRLTAPERVRDDKGKFVAGTPPAAPETPKVDEPATAAEPPTAEATPETPPDAEAANVVPWSFRGFNEDVAIPGAQYKAGHGVFIPEDALADVRRRIARGGARYDELRADIEKFRGGVTRKEIDAAAALDVLGPVFTAEWINEAAANPDLAIRELRIKIGERKQELEREHGAAVIDAAPRGSSGALDAEARFNLEDTVQLILRQPGIAASIRSAVQRDHVQAVVGDVWQSFFVPAPYDIPEIGAKQGEMVLDRHKLAAFIKREASALAPVASAKPAPVVPKPQPVVSAPPSATAHVGKSGSPKPVAPRTSAAPPSKAEIHAEFDAGLNEILAQV